MLDKNNLYILKSDMIDWLKDIKSRIKPQNFHTASEFEIAENQILNLIQMLQLGALPSVAIPNKTEIEAILKRFYNEEISGLDMAQEIRNVIER